MRRKARVATLSEVEPPELHAIRARKRQLFGLLLLVFVFVAAGLVLFSYASEVVLDRPVDFLDLPLLRVGFVALAVAFSLYVWEKERTLERLEHALIEERILSTALQNRLRELDAISRASRAVASVLSQDDVLALILESAQDLLGATEGSVMLFDEEKKTLRIAASVGLDPGVTRVIPVGEGVAGWVAEFRDPVILTGKLDDPRFRRFLPKDRPVRSAMSAPLYARAEPVGVLNISVSEGEREYTEHDLRALSVFAEHAAVAISNARLFESEKLASSRLAELDARRRDFLALVTHDLKTPLTSILGASRLLREFGEKATEEQQQELVAMVESQGQRMAAMVEQLIMSTSLEEGGAVLSREPLDLRELVEEGIAAFKGVLGSRSAEVSISENLPTVYGDRSAVEHILANLLDNAVKHSDDGTPVAVAVDTHPGEVQVRVSDRGSGIPEDVLPHIFDRYRRGGGPGGAGSVGLGLFIVRSLIEGHGGRAWATNREGGGAEVAFSLPVRRDDRT